MIDWLRRLFSHSKQDQVQVQVQVMDEADHANWPSYEPDSTNIWATIPSNNRRQFLSDLKESEKEYALQWNEVFRREAAAHRRGEKWNWDDHRGLSAGDIITKTAVGTGDHGDN